MPILGVAIEDIAKIRSNDNECEDFDEDCYELALEHACLACHAYDPDKGECPFLA